MISAIEAAPSITKANFLKSLTAIWVHLSNVSFYGLDDTNL
jgi:hypothetical protein